MNRCAWAKTEPLIAYHDAEWGVPCHDDRTLLEFLILEGAQAGLSWEIILKKRNNYRLAFDNFDARKIVKYDDRKVKALLGNPGIIRNRLKIAASIQNARAFLEVQQEFRAFESYLWKFVDDVPKQNRWKTGQAIPTRTAESDAMSKDLLRRGFKFVGSNIDGVARLSGDLLFLALPAAGEGSRRDSAERITAACLNYETKTPGYRGWSRR